MLSFKSFHQRLFQVDDVKFNELALELFRFQVENNSVYKNYINFLGKNPNEINQISEIPFLPIAFFKHHGIKTGEWQDDVVYRSSGTTQSVISKHHVKSNLDYLFNARAIFNLFYGDIQNYHMLFLLPSYLERGGSSLVAMADDFIKDSCSKFSGFYLNNYDELLNTINEIRNARDFKKILLCGVSFALLELAESLRPDLNDVIVMETGGMKGRRKEMIRAELHEYFCSSFNIKQVHSEYGMTELSSQAYSQGNGKFRTPPWMRILLRDVNDPFHIGERNSGGINVIDLANIWSCAFIETQDLGSIDRNGDLEIRGRFDNSDIRGCNLMV